MSELAQVDAQMLGAALSDVHSAQMVAELRANSPLAVAGILDRAVSGGALKAEDLTALARDLSPSHRDFLQAHRWTTRVLDPVRKGALDVEGLVGSVLAKALRQQIETFDARTLRYGRLAEEATSAARVDPTEPSPYSDLYVVLEWQAFQALWRALKKQIGADRLRELALKLRESGERPAELELPQLRRQNGRELLDWVAWTG